MISNQRRCLAWKAPYGAWLCSSFAYCEQSAKFDQWRNSKTVDYYRWIWLIEADWRIYICVSKITSIGSDNGLSPGRRQAIIWTNAGILLIRPLGTNFNEILIEIYTFSIKQMHLKMSSGKWRSFCLSLNALIYSYIIIALAVSRQKKAQRMNKNTNHYRRDTNTASICCRALSKLIKLIRWNRAHGACHQCADKCDHVPVTTNCWRVANRCTLPQDELIITYHL